MTIRLARDDEEVVPATTDGRGPNKTLKGHKLLLIVPTGSVPGPDQLRRLKAEFPGLEIAQHAQEWADRSVPEAVPGMDWKDVTILLTGNALPTREQAPRLQYVQLLSAGANHILKHPLFTDTDVAFCTANGVHGPQISEWIISTFLAFEHHIPKYLDIQKQARWERSQDAVEDAVGRRVGILGYGSIGRQVARLSKAMGMEVYAYTLHPRETPKSRRDETYAPPGTGDPEGIFPSKWFSGGTKEDIHRFLSSNLDLLVVAAPLTDKTTHLLGDQEFRLLGEGDRRGKAFVSNISRGPLVDTDALVEALDDGLIRGAALDVTDPEPLPDGHKLWSTKNVIITPHISGSSTAYGRRVFAILELNLLRLSEGRPFTNRVSRRDGY